MVEATCLNIRPEIIPVKMEPKKESDKSHSNENGTERGTRQHVKWLGLDSSSGTIFTGVTSNVRNDWG